MDDLKTTSEATWSREDSSKLIEAAERLDRWIVLVTIWLFVLSAACIFLAVR